MRVLINHKFPSLNDAIGAAKKHWAAYAKMKKENTTVVCLGLAPVKPSEPLALPAHIHLTFIEGKGRKRDWDNITFATKFVLDGLVDAGVIEDDSPRYILEVSTRVEYRDYYGVVIEINEDN